MKKHIRKFATYLGYVTIVALLLALVFNVGTALASWFEVNNFYNSFNNRQQASSPEQLEACAEMKEVIRPLVQRPLLDEGDIIEADDIKLYWRNTLFTEYNALVKHSDGTYETLCLRSFDYKVAVLMAEYFYGCSDSIPLLIIEPLPSKQDGINGYLMLSNEDPLADQSPQEFEYLLDHINSDH